MAPVAPDSARGVYGISVAAELAGLGVQTLRLYERRGLINPARTEGGTRLYSQDDIHRLRRVADLLAAGLNLAGIAMVFQLEADNDQLEADNDKLRDQLANRKTTSPARKPTRSRE